MNAHLTSQTAPAAAATMPEAHRYWSGSAPAFWIALVLTLLILVVAAGRCPAMEPEGAKSLVAVPSSGVAIELWSDPPEGSLVHPGSRARLYARANADCYLAVFSLDTEGRIRLLSPRPLDDGWVAGGRTYRIPEDRSGYDLVFTGREGLEYVFALASAYPLRERYPDWMAQGLEPAPLPEDWDEDVDPYRTGWVVGDPIYRIRAFCEAAVPYPQETESYGSSWIYFHLGRRVPYPRFLCSDCHGGGWVDPYGPTCSAVRVRIGNPRCSGVIDFRPGWSPFYTYEVWTGWRPRHWSGGRWNGPDGRWRWSSADGRRNLRSRFADAEPVGRVVSGPTGHGAPPGSGPWSRGPGEEHREDWRDHQRDARNGDPKGDRPENGREGRSAGGRDVRPSEPGPRVDGGGPWGRGFDERLRRAVGDRVDRNRRAEKPPRPVAPEARSERPHKPEVRNGEPHPGVTTEQPPSKPERDHQDRERSGSRDAAPRSADRSPREGHGRSR